MGNNPIPGTELASYERGFGDFTMKADMDSMREINYIGDHRQLIVFADLFETDSDTPITHAPRYLLRKVLEDFQMMGYTIQAQCDIDFTVLSDKYKKISSEYFSHITPVTEHSNLYNSLYKQNFDDFLNKLKNSLKFSNINVERIAGDKSPGQFRLSLSLTDPMKFCDNIVLLKLV
jgi:glutamine synthetase